MKNNYAIRAATPSAFGEFARRKAITSSVVPLSTRTRCSLWPVRTESVSGRGSMITGGKGIITMKTGEKTGEVVGALTVRETDEIMLITNKGQMVRTRVKEIRETGRNTMGVKLMDLRNDEKLQAIAPVVSQAEEEEAQSAEVPAQKS